MKNQRRRVMSVVAFTVARWIAAAVGEARPRKPVDCGEVEVLGGVAFTHCFARAAGLTWHYVEAGEGEPIVFIYGLPESWYSWHHQLEDLAADYRVIAIDLKGYGQSDKSDGNYHPARVGREVLALMDVIGLRRFNLVTHDWGSAVGDQLASEHPERILRYARTQFWLDRFNPWSSPQHILFGRPILVRALLFNPELFVRLAHLIVAVRSIPAEEMHRIVKEFSYPGIRKAVPRYFRDTDLAVFRGIRRRAAAMNFPVLLLQAEADPWQPPSYFDGATDLFPNAELQWIEGSGHFLEIEQPQAVTRALRAFLLNRDSLSSEYSQAEPLLLKSYPVITSQFGPPHNRSVVALKRIIDSYTRAGDGDQAERYRASSLL